MPKFAANLSMLFTELPVLDRFAAAAQAGFRGVEFLFLYDYDKAVLADCLGANGLVQVLHNLPAGDWAAGKRGIACHTPDVERALFGPGGVAEGLSRGKIVVDMSSISPLATKEFARRISEFGCEYLDALGRRSRRQGVLADDHGRRLAICV
jgi:hypothetical protein